MAGSTNICKDRGIQPLQAVLDFPCLLKGTFLSLGTTTAQAQPPFPQESSCEVMALDPKSQLSGKQDLTPSPPESMRAVSSLAKASKGFNSENPEHTEHTMGNADSNNLGIPSPIPTNRQQVWDGQQVPGCSPCPCALSPSWLPAQASSSRQGTAPKQRWGRGRVGEGRLESFTLLPAAVKGTECSLQDGDSSAFQSQLAHGADSS